MLAINTYLGHQFPSGVAPGVPRLVTACCHLLRAHILAYNCVHDLYREHGWSTPAVSLNNHCSDIYWADKLWLDLLSLRTAAVARPDVDRRLDEQARRFNHAFKHAPIPLHKDLAYRIGGMVKHAANAVGRRFLNSRSLGPLLDAIYASPREQLFDYLALGLLRSLRSARFSAAGLVGSRVSEQVVALLGDELTHEQMVGLARPPPRAPLFLRDLSQRISPPAPDRRKWNGLAPSARRPRPSPPRSNDAKPISPPAPARSGTHPPARHSAARLFALVSFR